MWPHGVRHPLPVTLLAIAVVCATALLLQHRLEQGLRDSIGNSLVAVRNSAHQAVRDWYRQHRRLVAVLGRAEIVRLAAEQALVATPGARTSAFEIRRLRTQFALNGDELGYREYLVVAPDGRCVESNLPQTIDRIGFAAHDPGFWQAVLAGDTAVSTPAMLDPMTMQAGEKPENRRALVFVGAPIVGSNGSTIALLLLPVDPMQSITPLMLGARIGDTGEVYALDAQGHMLSRSRFVEQLVAMRILGSDQASHGNFRVQAPSPASNGGEPQAALTRMAASLTAGRTDSTLEPYPDYRGVPVVGAWLWDAEYGIGIVAEQDAAEAFEALYRTRWMLGAGAALLSVLVIATMIMGQLWLRYREASRALERNKADLEQLVRERSAEALRMSHELESTSYSIAHDLRQPLRGLTGFSQILLTEAAEVLNPDQRAMLDRIAAAGLRMSELIDDILRLSRVARTEPAPVDTDASSIALELCTRFQAAEPARRCDIRIQPEMRVVADPRLLEDALSELLQNAWKFTAPVAAPSIAVSSAHIDGMIHIAVCDNGIGFDPSFTDKLFRPFQRLHQDFAGHGIGLAIVARIAHLHRGRTGAVCNADAGATFHIAFPLR